MLVNSASGRFPGPGRPGRGLGEAPGGPRRPPDSPKHNDLNDFGLDGLGLATGP